MLIDTTELYILILDSVALALSQGHGWGGGGGGGGGGFKKATKKKKKNLCQVSPKVMNGFGWSLACC